MDHGVRESTRVTNDRDRIDRLWHAIERAMVARDYSDASRFAVRLALEEAITNAFRHGLRDLPEDTPILVEYAVHQDRVHLAVEDPGPGFDPEHVPDPTLDENLTQPGGRGLLLIRAYMTSTSFANDGRRLEMTYDRPSDDHPDDQ